MCVQSWTTPEDAWAQQYQEMKGNVYSPNVIIFFDLLPKVFFTGNATE